MTADGLTGAVGDCPIGPALLSWQIKCKMFELKNQQTHTGHEAKMYSYTLKTSILSYSRTSLHKYTLSLQTRCATLLAQKSP